MNIRYLRVIGRDLGRSDALYLRKISSGISSTEIINEEIKIPAFKSGKDYSAWPTGGPVKDGDQVYKLLQPYNSADHPGLPSELRAHWGLCHTTNAAKAKPWVTPLGTSGIYMMDECYRDTDGRVYRALRDNLVHDAKEVPETWEEVLS